MDITVVAVLHLNIKAFKTTLIILY